MYLTIAKKWNGNLAEEQLGYDSHFQQLEILLSAEWHWAQNRPVSTGNPGHNAQITPNNRNIFLGQWTVVALQTPHLHLVRVFPLKWYRLALA